MSEEKPPILVLLRRALKHAVLAEVQEIHDGLLEFDRAFVLMGADPSEQLYVELREAIAVCKEHLEQMKSTQQIVDAALRRASTSLMN
jgi:hypothetical protein